MNGSSISADLRERLRAIADASDRPTRFMRTDMGNAERLVAEHGEDLRVVPGIGWMHWDGQRWRQDDSRETSRRMKLTIRAMYGEAELLEVEEERRSLMKWATSSESAPRVKAAIELAASDAAVIARSEDLDHDPLLLNVANGTLDLRTGSLREHRRDDLITRLAPVPYEADAECPTWLRFLSQILGGDADLLQWKQKALGYCLTGATSEQCLFVHHGTGANGKSTEAEILRDLLGDYAMQAEASSFMASRGGIPNDLARLRGARLVNATEVEEDSMLAESLVKRLTGEDTVTARFLHREYFDFRPQFKLVIAANRRPRIRGTDLAMWRRIRLVPYGVTIPEAARDPGLPSKLRAELPGILRWAVEGCVTWRREGLGIPPAVREATAAYRADEDLIGGFVGGRCTEDGRAQVSAADLYDAYQHYCREEGEEPLTKRMFGERLRERGFEPRKGAGGKRFWRGLALSRPAR